MRKLEQTGQITILHNARWYYLRSASHIFCQFECLPNITPFKKPIRVNQCEQISRKCANIPQMLLVCGFSAQIFPLFSSMIGPHMPLYTSIFMKVRLQYCATKCVVIACTVEQSKFANNILRYTVQYQCKRSWS